MVDTRKPKLGIIDVDVAMSDSKAWVSSENFWQEEIVIANDIFDVKWRKIGTYS